MHIEPCDHRVHLYKPRRYSLLGHVTYPTAPRLQTYTALVTVQNNKRLNQTQENMMQSRDVVSTRCMRLRPV